MLDATERRTRQIISLVSASGDLEVSLGSAPVPQPGPDEVVMRVEAAPINPSDLILLLAGVGASTLTQGGSADNPTLLGKVASVERLARRVGQTLPVGNEGAGTIVEAGGSPAAQALLGRVVAVGPGSGMYGEYRVLRAEQCLELENGATAIDGASAWINPLTALGFIETMRRDGHSALANTAAASNLGQMLVRLCAKDGIPLINIVRSAEQEQLLSDIGARYIVNSSAPTFLADLSDAFAETGATLAFDAIGGGKLPSQLLECMEGALNRRATTYSAYGSPTHKQVYIYGGLDPQPTVINRTFGTTWGLGGWLMTPFLKSLDPSRFTALKQRIASELTTTFASPHAAEVSLAGALKLDAVAGYTRRATGSKYLIVPQQQ